jgi:hypothetical protein
MTKAAGKPARIAALLFLLMLGALFFSSVRIIFTGNWRGLFLLHGQQGRLELTDDLFLNDERRLILALRPDFGALFGAKEEAAAGPRLALDWNAAAGNGWVRNDLGDGRHWVVYFSRFRDGDDRATRGLFVGGGHPEQLTAKAPDHLNKTGMALFNGQKWLHIWCNVDEGIIPGHAPKGGGLYPSQWEFLGSEILLNTPQRLLLTSRHRVVLDGVPLEIQRQAYFRAGETYFLLAFSIRNVGSKPAPYLYIYGDEPWLGDYGSAASNIGWVENDLVIHQGEINLQRYNFAGMLDLDSGAANFIEWLGGRPPDTVYLANDAGAFVPASAQAPLLGNARFIGVEWGRVRHLPPQTTDHYVLAIGVATERQPMTGMPVKPRVVPRALPRE